MAYSLIAHVAAGSGDGFDFTTGSIDTTGADFVVVAAAFYVLAGGAPVVTDNKGNAWHERTVKSNTADGAGVLFHADSTPTVGSGHTFTFGNGNIDRSYGAIAVAAFSGSLTTPFDVENGNTALAVTSLAAGSITPNLDNELIAAGFGSGVGISNLAIDSGLTISDQVAFAAAAHYGVALAYLAQGTAAAINPTWSWTTADNVTAVIAAFKAAVAASGFSRLLAMDRNRLVEANT